MPVTTPESTVELVVDGFTAVADRDESGRWHFTLYRTRRPTPLLGCVYLTPLAASAPPHGSTPAGYEDAHAALEAAVDAARDYRMATSAAVYELSTALASRPIHIPDDANKTTHRALEAADLDRNRRAMVSAGRELEKRVAPLRGYQMGTWMEGR